MFELTPFLWTVFWNIIIAIWIVWVIFLVKFITKKLDSYLDYITAITVWLLLWIIFLWFIPEIFNSQIDNFKVWVFLLLWIFIFYILELFLHWHHCKDLGENEIEIQKHKHKDWWLILVWTFLHNAFHWIVLFWAFAVSFSFWVATTIAVLLHSIPQNVVNYIMNHKRIKIVIISAVAWIFWSLLTYPFAGFLIDMKYYVLSIIAWWLLYTALADIFPNFKSKWHYKNKIIYLLFVIIWVFIFLWFEELTHHSEHNYVEVLE